MPQQTFVEIVDSLGILWEESLQKRVSIVRCDFFPNQADSEYTTGTTWLIIHADSLSKFNSEISSLITAKNCTTICTSYPDEPAKPLNLFLRMFKI